MPAKRKTTEAPAPPKAPAELIANWKERRDMYAQVFEALVRTNALLDEGSKLLGDILVKLNADGYALIREMRPYDPKREEAGNA